MAPLSMLSQVRATMKDRLNRLSLLHQNNAVADQYSNLVNGSGDFHFPSASKPEIDNNTYSCVEPNAEIELPPLSTEQQLEHTNKATGAVISESDSGLEQRPNLERLEDVEPPPSSSTDATTPGSPAMCGTASGDNNGDGPMTAPNSGEESKKSTTLEKDRKQNGGRLKLPTTSGVRGTIVLMLYFAVCSFEVSKTVDSSRVLVEFKPALRCTPALCYFKPAILPNASWSNIFQMD